MIRPWHAALALIAAAALIGQTLLMIQNDASLVNLFSYFTIQSNLLMLIASVVLVINPDRRGTAFGILRLAGLVGITVTGIVYTTILAGTASFEGPAWWYDKMMHYVVPVMSVIGFLAFRPRTRFEKSAWWFIVWPVAWLAYTLIRAEVVAPVFPLTKDTNAPVPYGFLDAGEHGAGFVAIAGLVVTALMLGIAWAYVKFSQREPAPV